MGCGCNKGAGTGRAKPGDTLGYYVVLPDGSMMPQGINPENPDAGEPPYFLYAEAHSEVVQSGGGTVHRLRRQPVTG